MNVGRGDWHRKAYRHGTDRVVAPDATVVRARAFMAEMGITRVANITGLDRIGIPVVAVTRPNARSVSVAQGKGVSLDAAKASGLMESIEGYHAEHVELPLFLATYEDVGRRGRAVDVERLPKTREGSFPPATKLLWVEGRDLLNERSVWVPFEMVHTDYTLPLPQGSGSFLMSSNGLASGNHELEAISHGLCELVERDAAALCSLSTALDNAARRIDCGSIDEPVARNLLEQLERAGVDACIWDITSDVGIAAFRCELADCRAAGYRLMLPVSGFGCHPRREIALTRAITESAQGRLTVISGARDDLSQWLYDHDDAARATADFALRRTAPGPLRNYRDVPTCEAPTLEEDVAWELARLQAAGLSEVVYVDLSKPQFQLPVARVIVPGLESLCEAPGYAPGARAAQRRAESVR